MKISAFSLVLGVLGDAHGVHIQVGALLGQAEGQVGVDLLHGEEVAVVVGADGGGAALHLLKDVVHHVGLHQGLLLDEQVHSLFDLVLVGGVVGVAQLLQGDADGVPGSC